MLLALYTVAAAHSVLEQTNFTPQRLAELRNTTADLFFHSWNAYRDNALPMDELRPLTCEGVGPDPDITHIQRNDIMGNFSITLLDSLDMFAILDRDDLFEYYVDYIKHNVHFDQPYVVQVFEVTIRAMGGLLSAHMYASVPELGHAIKGYDGHLLAKAYDLGLRLLPAFDTPTGIPHPRVHLIDGVVPIGNESITSTCSAGAGSLLVEFGMLSRLTNDWRFDKLARRACFKVWDRRSTDHLVGNGIDALTGKWTDKFTSIGAGVDSYYECVLKYAVLFNDATMWDIWSESYLAIQEYLCSGIYYHMVLFSDPNLKMSTIDALSAFWAGVQVLAGEIADAVRTHLGYFKLWSNWAGIPERYILSEESDETSIELEWYLLRPEFIESTYYLHQATKDPIYLHTGQVVLEDLLKYNKVPCGVAATQDVRNGAKSDRMDSFFLSETLKYLYLLFDPDHPLNRDSSNVIFTTEAHPTWSSPQYIKKASIENFPSHEIILDAEPTSILKWAYNLLEPWVSTRQWFASTQNTLMCPAYKQVDYSVMASWEGFYAIDTVVEFIPPPWLQRGGIEHEHEFMKRYVHYDAQCIA